MQSKLTKLFSSSVNKANLSKQFYSGELDMLRRQNINSGDVNWRIIKYQRIINPEVLPFPISNYKYVLPETFEKNIKYLIKNNTIVPLSKLITSLEENKEISDKTVAITFDGAWLDIFINAIPILQKYDVHATIFLPTSYITSEELFWEDKTVFILKYIQSKSLTLPLLEILPDFIAETIKRKSPENIITNEIIFLFILGLSLCDLQTRLTAFNTLNLIMNSLNAEIPKVHSYMNWEELQTIEELGFTIASQGNISHLLNDFDINTAKLDIKKSFELLHNKLNSSSEYVSLQAGIASENLQTAMKELGYKYLFAADNYISTSELNNELNIFKRTTFFQNAVALNENLYCHLWNIEVND